MSTPVRDHRNSIGQTTAAQSMQGRSTLHVTWPGRRGRRPHARIAAAAAVLASTLLAASLLGAGAAAAGAATVQAPPSPLRFVSSLDLECFRTPPYAPPPTVAPTRHLNPVLAQLPAEPNVLGLREQLCVPVATNSLIPPDSTSSGSSPWPATARAERP